MVVYLVGNKFTKEQREKAKCNYTCTWGVAGIYSTKKKAIVACKDASYFYAPMTIDAPEKEGIIEFPDAVFPVTDHVFFSWAGFNRKKRR